jgi:hypothetical protein
MRGALFALLLLLSCAPARAQAFDDALEAALGHWRAASWYARTGNSAVAALEAEEFRTRWRALAAQFATPPAPFGRDPAWSETLRRIEDAASSAADALGRDDAAAAARALRQIGQALSDLRARNGVVSFSDHVAKYRDAVDRLSELSLDDQLDPARISALRGMTERTAEAVAALEQNVPGRWRSDPAMDGLLRQNRDGVAALAAALARPDLPSTLEIVGLIGVVRANYNLLFLRFGGVPPPASVAQIGADR